MSTRTSMQLCRHLLLSGFLFLIGPGVAESQEKPTPQELARLPGGTTAPVGNVEKNPYEMEAGPRCEKGMIVVPENRFADESRNIKLYFYQFKARNPSGRAPIFMLPGGPGGFYNDNWVNGLRQKPDGGSNGEAWLYTQDRDVVLVNQRGARLPDRSFQNFRFLARGASIGEPYSSVMIAEEMKIGAERSIKHWSGLGMDLAGYDIMNMVEDINDLRHALGYEKIALRGTSFGSQWSFAYLGKYPQHVDRAVLSGVEPLDYGYDSHEGVWNVLKRLEGLIQESNDKDNRLNLPTVGLTDAIKEIVSRLEAHPIEIEIQHPTRDFKRKIPIGHEDFQRQLRQGILAGHESIDSLANLPRFVLEVYNEDYRYLASRTIEQRNGFSGGSLQLILIDNSLGISEVRDAKLANEPARRWLGELNTTYKATRDVTPTAVIPDSFRKIDSNVPILLVQGDMDLSTPIENAEEALETLSNCHMIRIVGGTHGAFHQIHRQDKSFMKNVKRFLDAEFSNGKTSVQDLGLPTEMILPKLNFQPVGSPSLFDTLMKK